MAKIHDHAFTGLTPNHVFTGLTPIRVVCCQNSRCKTLFQIPVAQPDTVYICPKCGKKYQRGDKKESA